MCAYDVCVYVYVWVCVLIYLFICNTKHIYIIKTFVFKDLGVLQKSVTDP
jgi:hypothetical protein